MMDPHDTIEDDPTPVPGLAFGLTITASGVVGQGTASEAPEQGDQQT